MQNVVVDLLLGLGFNDAFRIFADHVRDAVRRRAGLHHDEPAAAARRARRGGVENPIVCSNINKIGFRMSGGVEGYLDALDNRPFRAVAMSVFACGAIPPREAIEWVCGLPNLESIVFGASSRANIASTRRLVEEYWPCSSTGLKAAVA